MNSSREYYHVNLKPYLKGICVLTLYAPTPQNGQTHSDNSSAKADGLFEYVWPFCGVGA